MTTTNAFYAQSGGVTAVINASACGVIETARKHPDRILPTQNPSDGNFASVGNFARDPE